jgi:integrase
MPPAGLEPATLCLEVFQALTTPSLRLVTYSLQNTTFHRRFQPSLYVLTTFRYNLAPALSLWKQFVVNEKKKKRKNPPHTWRDPKTGDLYAVYTCKSRMGKRKFYYRKARNASHAKELYRALESEHRQGGEEALDGARLTFNQLADYAEKHFVKEPTFASGIKVSGMKSWKDARLKLKFMRSVFGNRRVRSITADDIAAYRDMRLSTPTRRKREGPNGEREPKPRTLASVQRELSLLRRILNIARRRRWIPFNPFDEGGFISNASEEKRTRIISRDEEERLLLACEKTDKVKEGATKKKSLKHLRPFIICGVETGMRSGEMFKMRWRDVDFEGRSIHIIASNTKVEQARDVPITGRLLAELETLWNNSTQDLNELVFGFSRVKRGWTSLCAEAKVFGATPHDLRHTAATRMIEGGLSIAETARILGHSSITTTYRYVNAHAGTLARATEALER